ncbi:MAG: hypothetical protein H5T44_05775 [Thermoplasmatales archaeon]|nr:hypothetical protein [Thermoplasmatales archaeon]
MKIFAMADGGIAELLRMAGANICSCKEFDEVVRRKDAGLLIISEKFVDELKDKILMHRLQGNAPFIIEISGKEKVGEDSIKKIIVRAVGVEV